MRSRFLALSLSRVLSQADSTEIFLQSQLTNLERLLSTNSNKRRQGTTQSQAKTAAYQMRMDRYRSDLTRINATWNAMDAEAAGSAGAGAGGGASFDAAPPAPESVQTEDDKSVLSAWCTRFRDKGAGYNLNKQISVLQKCYDQDCEQSLEGGDINRPDQVLSLLSRARSLCVRGCVPGSCRALTHALAKPKPTYSNLHESD